jgi:lysozyme
VNNRNAGLALAALLAGSAGGLAIIKPWEGKRNIGYPDVSAVPTVCYGHTAGARIGEYRSDAECEVLLDKDVRAVIVGLSSCVRRPVKPHEAAALISWSFNVGTSAACRSTLVRELNEGHPADEWCHELLRWDKDNGRVILGLTNRRRAEYSVCIGNAHK